VNRQTKRMMQRQGQMDPDGSGAPARPQVSTRARPAPRSTPRTTPAEFLREVRSELHKVAWPTRSEVANYSSVVLVTLVLLISFIFVLNYGFQKAVMTLLGT